MNGKEAIDGAAPGATGARGDEHGQSIGGDSVQAHDTPGGAGLSSPGTRRGRRASRDVPIYAANGRVVAHVTPPGVLVKYVRPSRGHLLRQPPAVCFDLCVLEQAKAAGAWRALVVDLESGRRYTASMETITGRGFAINRGYGEQWAVPLKFWHLTRRNLRASAAQDVAGDDTDGTEGEQLPLTGFGGTA